MRARHAVWASPGIGSGADLQGIPPMIELGSLTLADDGRFRGQIQTLGHCADIELAPQDGFLPDQVDYQVLWSGLTIGMGSTQVDDMSGYQTIVLHVAQPHWGPRPLKITVVHVPETFEPEIYRMIWRPLS